MRWPEPVMPTVHPAAASSTPSPPLVEFRNVSCGYGEHVVLSNINLALPRGQVVGLMGTSGGGKTTVLKLIGRQLEPMTGEVLFDGVDLAGLDRRRRRLRRGVGVVQ